MEQKILNLFAYNESLSFGEIQKSIGSRSNLLAYHLKKLVKEKKLSKENNAYKISPESEYLIPHLTSKQSVLPVILVHIGDNKKAFLIKRSKRPFKGLYGLPGGRLLVGESIFQAAERILREKSEIKIKNQNLSHIVLEHVKKKGKIIHSFLLIVIKAEADVPLIEIKKNQTQIISSDFTIIREIKPSNIKEVITNS